MAENNIATNAENQNPLQDVSFQNVIAGPLLACVDAQRAAAEATRDYLFAVGFRDDKEGRADFEPEWLTFYFLKDGVTHRLRLPLISVIPIPYLQIGYIDLNYQATVTGCKKDSLTVKYTTATARTKSDRNLEKTGSVVARECIDINIRATTADMPAGMGKLMEIFNTQFTDMHDEREE